MRKEELSAETIEAIALMPKGAKPMLGAIQWRLDGTCEVGWSRSLSP
jgi:hypothetical protein